MVDEEDYPVWSPQLITRLGKRDCPPKGIDRKSDSELLDKFIMQEMDKCRDGSGDDEYYAHQVPEYINQQRALWLGFVEFIDNHRQKKDEK